MSQTLSLKIGPSGVRGVIGESLTPQLVTSFAAAFGTYCGAGPILIGTDPRPSADMLKQATIAGLLSVGCTPVDLGVVPVPSLMLHVRAAGAFGGIMISGGHGSAEWNALRFISAEGLALRANQAAELTDLYHQGSFPRVRASEMSEVRSDTTAVARHVRVITHGVDAARIHARGLRVAVDAKGGAAADAVVQMLEALGCTLTSLDPATGGRGQSDELDVTDVGALVRSAGADLGVAIDADGDRLALTDERGEPLGPDGPVVLAVQYWLERRPGPVVVNVAATRAVDDVAAAAGARVVRCRVGEASLVESMIEHGADIGGEGDGGVVVRPLNPCRDSLAALALLLEAIAASGTTVSALRARAPRYASARERLLCSAREIAPSLRLISHAFRGEQFDLTDGVKVVWPDRWLLARPAATEPVIRISSEAPTDAEARALITGIIELLSPGA
jgi:phosphomannomutase